MSKLDDAWMNIQGWLTDATRPKPEPGTFSPEYAQAMSRFMHGTNKVKEDIDYFLENAPLGDPRRAGVLHVKKLMDKSPGA